MTTKAEQITLDIRRRFDAGEFSAEDKFETFAELQQRYGVDGVGTIQAALEPLWHEGILRSEHGRGTFVQRVPPPQPVASDHEDALATLDTVLTEISADLARLASRLEAARALLKLNKPSVTKAQPPPQPGVSQVPDVVAALRPTPVRLPERAGNRLFSSSWIITTLIAEVTIHGVFGKPS